MAGGDCQIVLFLSFSIYNLQSQISYIPLCSLWFILIARDQLRVFAHRSVQDQI